ncbi:hypothetical protein GCM10023319_62850 [Nocardia iowensis]
MTASGYTLLEGGGHRACHRPAINPFSLRPHHDGRKCHGGVVDGDPPYGLTDADHIDSVYGSRARTEITHIRGE